MIDTSLPAAAAEGIDAQDSSSGISRVRVSQGEYDLIERVRGSIRRGTWVRVAALWAARRFGEQLPPVVVGAMPARGPAGERFSVSFRISDAEVAAIDAVRGNLRRDTWIREAAVRVAVGIESNAWAAQEVIAGSGPETPEPVATSE